ncbi:MAG: L-seryl-tRNA(Sec) selenium transferase [Defluviitaleaceae bacterium]|nr:L-seryl-tRNA(Sec) selenium transferase [Defluviitaleaceae bacterium]
MSVNDILRRLPKVDVLMSRLGEESNLAAIREVLASLRRDILAGKIHDIPDEFALFQMVAEKSQKAAEFGLRRVINATGIPLHTNLGRAPLPQSVAEHVKQVAMGYSTLEYNLDTGSRGSRMTAVQQHLTKLCGTEAAVCVNNNAAAVLLVLAALCGGGDVVISRGELVEVGGSFRIPDVISQGGARLVEVGATNKTHLLDYATAIGPETSTILKVHTSNYRIVGFTEEVRLTELAKLAGYHDIPLIYDLGGGSLIKLSQHEPTVQEIVTHGADIVCFSGDKLLGGPQCGIIVGKSTYIDKIVKHPLYRALRMDKLTLAALEATLKLYEEGRTEDIPILAMLMKSISDLKQDAEKLSSLIVANESRFSMEIVEAAGQAGGGSLPTEEFPSFALAISPTTMPLHVLEEQLRQWYIPIVARIYKERLLIDIRTVLNEDFAEIANAINTIFGEACDEH